MANDITIPQVAGAILDGVQRRITPLTHAELNMELMCKAGDM